MSNNIPDVQSSADTRNIFIHRVGIKDLTHPIVFRFSGLIQNSVAKVTMTVSLPAEVKGTHMSRFVMLLNECYSDISLHTLEGITRRMLDLLNAEEGTIDLSFPVFINKVAPVSRSMAFLDYQLRLVADVSEGEFKLSLEILVPLTSLCPCSKKISDYGAHNQRAHVTLNFDSVNSDFDLVKIIQDVESQGAAPLFALLKRPDEKFVTELAYDNPKFVEDLVRSVTIAIEKNTGFQNFFTVGSENFESIHNHSVYAIVKRKL